MTTNTDVVNRALQFVGTRTTVTDNELATNGSNEAIQANLVLTQFRDQLLRMAPWNCGMKTANLTYITSIPGTPENTSPATALWQPGQPRPSWAYEYQYPVDCLKGCWVIPATQQGAAGSVPITTAVTGSAPTLWTPPVRFIVGTDDFYAVTAATVVAGGTGYAVGDLITLVGTTAGSVPIGAPVVLKVATAPAGVVATVTVVNQVLGEATPLGGSYFLPQSGTIAQGSTTGSGTGATFTITQQSTQSKQRVILTNQEFATFVYVCQVTDPNVMDPEFVEAWVCVLGARLVKALTGNVAQANSLIAEANAYIAQARKDDGNEALTINDVTPDWVRIRGIWASEYMSGPYIGFDWGSMWPGY